MASRRLAQQFNQALRSRAALKAVQPVKRGFATPVGVPSRTQSTTVCVVNSYLASGSQLLTDRRAM